MGHSQILDHFFEEQHRKWKKKAHEIYKITCKEYGIHPNLSKDHKDQNKPNPASVSQTEKQNSNQK